MLSSAHPPCGYVVLLLTIDRMFTGLPYLIAMRLCVSLCMAAKKQYDDPTNKHAQVQYGCPQI